MGASQSATQGIKDTASKTSPRIAVIGSGFGGLGMGVYLKKAGIESFTIFEKANAIGGVWRENTYPNAACDVPSHMYSYSFEPHYPWAHRYGHQAQILAYQNHVAQKYGLMQHVRFGQQMTGAEFDEARNVWVIRFADESTYEADVLISAVGQLHRPQIPDIKGLESFKGPAFHSATWDHSYDFKDKTVAVIGTGASAVQFVPAIAKQVRKLHVFQRSPAWCIPKFDRQFNWFERKLLDTVPAVYDLDRNRIFWFMEFITSALTSRGVVSKIADFFLKTLAKTLMWLQVRDPVLRKKLTPTSPFGCKRTLLSNEWLKTLASPQVELVTDGISEVTPKGVKTEGGKLREVDAIVFGTGFSATQFLAPMDLKGLKGQSLRQLWKDGAEAYLGLSVAGFPNFFMMYGPNTNLGAGSIIYMLEAQNQYVVRCIQKLQESGQRRISVSTQAQSEFNELLHQRNKDASYESGCHSWYINAQGRNTNNWVGFTGDYARRVRAPVFEHYQLGT